MYDFTHTIKSLALEKGTKFSQAKEIKKAESKKQNF